MANHEISRRRFVQAGAAVAAALAVGAGPRLARPEDLAAIQKTPSYNPEMEYRRLGKTNLWVSAVCMGGHWKRINTMIKEKMGSGWEPVTNDDTPTFDKNRYDVVSRCLEVGINLVDACSGREIMTYSKALKGRRDKMIMTFSWFEKESRYPEWRTAAKLLQGMEEGMKDAGLDHIDIWRISAMMDGKHTHGEVEEMIKALDTAKKQGKVRFTGLSSHNREWLKAMIETYPNQIEVVLCPYTADSQVLREDSLFDAVTRYDVGYLGIKPFANASLFKGDSSPNSPHAEEDSRRARLAIRNILANPAVTAPMPGLISAAQVDNMAAAIKERRHLDSGEKAELRQAATEMWARLSDDYQWLKEWKQV